VWCEKRGYKPHTIRGALNSLKSVDRRTDLLDPQAVLSYLAYAKFGDVRRENLATHLERFYKWKGIPFDKPRYKSAETLPFIPTETEVDQLVGGLGKKSAAFLQLLKETGVRCGEGWAIRWTDLDVERNTVNIVPEKGSRARQLRVSPRLLAMVNALPRKGAFIFHTTEADPITSLDHFRRVFDRQRKKVAERLENPRIMQIHWHTLRHYRACVEYHKTKDLLHVMQILGHRNIMNTMRYTRLIDFPSDEFASKVATSQKEITELIESGFEFILQKDGLAYFRKRK
jgi:type 1 fimbriae regulatory protein FimB/type 1 fimbriae regulatory protein FimE